MLFLMNRASFCLYWWKKRRTLDNNFPTEVFVRGNMMEQRQLALFSWFGFCRWRGIIEDIGSRQHISGPWYKALSSWSYDAYIDEDILQYQYLCQTRAGRNDLAEIGLWGRKIGNRHRLASSWCDIDLMLSWGYNIRGDLWFMIFLMMSSLFVAARESWTKTNKQRF